MRLIDADALKRDWLFRGDDGKPYRDTIDEQPTIEERKTGEWIRLDKDNMFFVPHMYKCSVCGNTLDTHGVNAGRGDANFCPNCGADMRGEQNEP